jgi:hypothetical protein
VDKIGGWARWVTRKGNGDGNSQGNNGNGHGNGNEMELWTVSDGNGFQILRFTEKFKKEHEDLFQGGDE